MQDGEILTGEQFRSRFPNQAGALGRNRDQAGRPDAAADRIRAAMAQAQAQEKAKARRQSAVSTEANATNEQSEENATASADLVELLRQTPDEDPTIWR